MPNVWSNDELNRACRCCRPTAGRSVADLVGFSAPPADYARVGWKIEGNGWTDTERHQKGQKRRIVAIARRWVLPIRRTFGRLFTSGYGLSPRE